MSFQQDLPLTNHLFSGIWQNSPDNFFILEVCGDDFRFVGINPAQERVLNLKNSEVEGTNLRDMIESDFYDFVTRNYRRCLQEQQSIQYEEEEAFTSEETRWWSTMLNPIRDDDGEIRYIYGISRNITELKLSQIESLQAAKAAEEANRVKTNFLANMSHEMRTPLNGIAGAANLILSSDNPEETLELASLISQSVDALPHLTSDILEYAKIGVGKLTLEPVSFDFHQAIDSVYRLLLPQAHNKNIELTLHVDTEVPRYLFADGQRIKQVLLNLVGNAVKFTEQGGVQLRVRTTQQGKDVAHIEIQVIDTGIGIREEHFDKLFKPFSQVDDSKTKQHEGTGLGLAISKSIVELMGGTINMKSQIDQGSEFTVACVVALGQPDVREGITDQPLHGHFLIVEDNSVNQIILKKLLLKHGAQVTVAENGKEALAACRETHFDMVLMDWHMPVMDGFEATRLIRQQLDHYQEVPIIGVTANVIDSETGSHIQAGMNDVLTKPIKREELVPKLYEWLSVGTLSDSL
jgi:PAS domain S-box-containing protein